MNIRLMILALLGQFAFNSVLLSQEELTQANLYLDSLFKSKEPGGAIIVATKDTILYEKYSGLANAELGVPINDNTLFRIGSVTKPITASIILRLHEKGLLNLEDPITKHLPMFITEHPVRIVDLLTHSSGIKNYTTMDTWTDSFRKADHSRSEMIDFFYDSTLEFEPGTMWRYNDSGYYLLGVIAEKVTQLPFNEVLKLELSNSSKTGSMLMDANHNIILNRASGYHFSKKGFINAPYLSDSQAFSAGGVLASAPALYKWFNALLNNRLLKEHNLSKMLSSYRLPGGRTINYSLGFRIDESTDKIVSHDGFINGFLSDIRYSPDKNIVVICLLNNMKHDPRKITKDLIALWSIKE